MRKIIILLLFVVSYNYAKSQIVSSFEFNFRDTPHAVKSFRNSLLEELRKSFYILESDIGKITPEIAISNIRDYFKRTIDPSFEPASYLLSCTVEPSIRSRNDYFFISIEVIETESRKKYGISLDNIPAKNLNDFAKYAALFYKYTIPTYYPIIAFNSEENFVTIAYGSDRNANSGDEFDLNSINGLPVGKLEVDEVHGIASFCDFELFDINSDFNEDTYRKHFALTEVNFNKAQAYQEELEDLQEQPSKDDEPSYTQPKRELVNITAQNFYFTKTSIKEYFDKEEFKPLVFGAQFNIIPMEHFAIFLKGRVSLISEILEQYKGVNNISSKFLFFQGGGGIQINIPLANILYPGVAVSVQYMEIVISKDNQGVILATEHYRGFDAELNAHCALRIYDFFGIYGEAAYHYYPLLKGSIEDWNTTALSFGVGLTFFIDS